MGIINVTPDSFADGGAALRSRTRRGRRLADARGRRRHPRRRRRIHAPGRRAGRRRRGAAARAAGPRGLRAAVRSSRSTPTRRWSRGRPSRAARRSSTTSARCTTTATSRGVVAETRRRRRADAQPRAVAGHVPRSGLRRRAGGDRRDELGSTPSTRAVGAGVSRDAIIVDPGLGFAKQARALVSGARAASIASPRWTVPSSPDRRASRFCSAAIGDVPPEERDWATAAAVAASVAAGRAHRPRARGARDGPGRPGRRRHPRRRGSASGSPGRVRLCSVESAPHDHDRS